MLIRIRGALSQTEAGRRAGQYLASGRALSQSRISRAEEGRYPLSPDEADAFARGCGASTTQRRELVRLARDFAAGAVTSRAALQRNAVAIQHRIARLEAESTLIRSWQDVIVIGLLQTAEYRAAVQGSDPGPRWREARALRDQQFREPGREWRLLMYEGALRWPLAGNDVMAAQMRHLVEVSTLPSVRLGIVDQGSVKGWPAPAGAFHLYGSRTAVSATEVGTTFLTDPADVRRYEDLFGLLEEAAVFGDSARELLGELERVYAARA